MEFSEQYLTYEEYRSLGGTLDLASFNLLEFEAHRKIDSMTQNRLINEKNIPKEVKICEYKMIDSIATFDETLESVSGKGNIKTENTDGYSISYVSASEIQDIIKSKSIELEDIIRSYLLGVIYNGEHLMYVGVK